MSTNLSAAGSGPHDMIAVAISAAALLLSILSLVLTYRQKSRQDALASRKALTDVIAAIAETNMEMAKLPSGKTPSPEVVIVRRNLNSQRRYLVNHARLLMEEIPSLTTDIDHNLVAGALDTAGDYEASDLHWRRSIEKSPSPAIKAFNLRGYARFLFFRGNPQGAREHYNLSLLATPSDSDANREHRADTLLFWAKMERDFGFLIEADRLREQARNEAERIGIVSRRAEMLHRIENEWVEAPESGPRKPEESKQP